MTTVGWKRSVVAGIACLFLASCGWLRAEPRSLEYAPAPPDNPLKGFVPYDGGNTNFPHSLEFFYLPVAAVQTDYATFDWAALDRKLQSISGRGHQAVLRFYLDYPNVRSGIPPFLSHVPVRQYDDWGNGRSARSVSPDYSHPDLRRALTNFIAALGARHDADPRIGFLTAGLLGFWGEWHTYPHTGFEGTTNWFAPTTVQREVLDAYESAFLTTPILLREPKPGVEIATRRLGFHDDSFAFSTLGPEAWHFWPVIQSFGQTKIWRTQPIGGEIRPELWNCIWDEQSCAPPGQEFIRCVDTTHASWLLDSGTFRGITGANRERALAGARRLGYELFVTSVDLPEETLAGQPFSISLAITNTGVAPLYYRWPVHCALLGKDGALQQWTNDWDITSIQPGEPPRVFKFEGTLEGVASGEYVAVLSVPNPMAGGQPVRFANATQDAHLPGWLTLGSLRIRAAPRLGTPQLRQGNLQIQIDGLRVGAETEIHRASVQPATAWEIVEVFNSQAPSLLWSRVEERRSASFFRLYQRERGEE